MLLQWSSFISKIDKLTDEKESENSATVHKYVMTQKYFLL